MNAPLLAFKRVSCFVHPKDEHRYREICEHRAIATSRSLGVNPNANDPTCMKDVALKLFEHRYHEVEPLDNQQVNCGVPVDYRKGNTCYKKTEPMSWQDARTQCWNWGGELAFPLKSDEDCKRRTYIPDTEEV